MHTATPTYYFLDPPGANTMMYGTRMQIETQMLYHFRLAWVDAFFLSKCGIFVEVP